MTLITTPVARKKALPKVFSSRLTAEQAKTFARLGGTEWLRAQLDAIAAMNAKGKK